MDFKKWKDYKIYHVLVLLYHSYSCEDSESELNNKQLFMKPESIKNIWSLVKK